jgi:hypothetical protein
VASAAGATELTGLRAQGAISVSPRGGWRMGWLNLGKETLTFQPPGRRGAVRIDLGSVTRLDVERRTFVVCAKRVVRLTYRPSRAACPRACWMITAQLGDWAAALTRRTELERPEMPIAEPRPPVPHDLAAGLTGLRGTPGLVLDYLSHRGYATTAELMTLTGAATEETLFSHLDEGFRRIASTLGGPVIRCVGTHFDRRSGLVRQQAWRLSETVAHGWLAARVPTDVLLEDDDELVVVTSVPTQARNTLPCARVDPDGRGFVVHSAHGPDRWIPLPVAVGGEAQCAMSGTGTLVIRARRNPAASAPRRPAVSGGGYGGSTPVAGRSQHAGPG